MSYYATHPQSHYREGFASYDFVGMARAERQKAMPRVPHIHFCGAAGNITAGKYNDGAPENRVVLAQRLSDGIARATDAASTNRLPVTDGDVAWSVREVQLAADNHLDGGDAHELFERDPNPLNAIHLASSNRVIAGPAVLSCLRLGPARMISFPGEPFIEYQLVAQRMRPELFVALAGYSDLGFGYICTEVAYQQGGYEIGMSYVVPQSEALLTSALADLLEAPPNQIQAPSSIVSVG
jgi:hypothetical protein